MPELSLMPEPGEAPARAAAPEPAPAPATPPPEPELVAEFDASVTIGFPGKRLAAEISLPVLPLDALPSQLAAERLQKMLKGKESARDVLGRTETQFSRLLHVQLFGADKSYEKHSDATLMQQLLHVEEANEAEDKHYQFEQRTHKLQLEIRNNLEYDIDPVTVVLAIRHADGVGVSERIYPEPGVKSSPSPGYPIVEMSAGRLVAHATTSRLRAGSKRPVFREPLRLWLREPAAGKTIIVDYTLQCRDLAEPITGSLRIRVVAARRSAAASTRRPTGTG